MSEYDRAFFRGFGLALASLSSAHDLPTTARDIAKSNGIGRKELLGCEPDEYSRKQIERIFPIRTKE